MNSVDIRRALNCAIRAARAAGALMRRNLHSRKRVNETTRHDIKLELDERCQRLIERQLRAAFPAISLLGEEGVSGHASAPARWVVDPIDGTVNFAYGIPHACVCIALQVRSRAKAARVDDGFATIVGVIYDPFQDELWSAAKGGAAHLNGRPVRVSRRSRLEEAIVTTGFGKDPAMIRESEKIFGSLVQRCRKVRVMGSAGLALTYVACGRFDAYIERVAGLWDIAAGGFIVERAGGIFQREKLADGASYRLVASNRPLHKKLAMNC